MPIYDYRCSSCKKHYDIYHRSKEIIENIVCPACGSNEYVKLISAPMISISTSSSGASQDCDSCSDNVAPTCSGGMCGL